MKCAPVYFRFHGVSMATALILLIAGVVPSPLCAQDYKFTIPTTQVWTDTGVDLQAGNQLAVTAVSSAGGCDPVGVASASGSALSLPVAAANPGALIARMQENGPVALVGASQQLRAAEAGHLFLGANFSSTPPCQGSFAVKVHITPSSASAEPMAATTSS